MGLERSRSPAIEGGQNRTSVSSGLGVPGNLQARTVTADPQDPRVLHVGLVAKQTETGGVLNTIQGGLFKSADEGLSRSRLDVDLPWLRVRDILVDPIHPHFLHAAVSGGYDHALGVLYPGGVCRSSDSGLT